MTNEGLESAENLDSLIMHLLEDEEGYPALAEVRHPRAETLSDAFTATLNYIIVNVNLAHLFLMDDYKPKDIIIKNEFAGYKSFNPEIYDDILDEISEDIDSLQEAINIERKDVILHKNEYNQSIALMKAAEKKLAKIGLYYSFGDSHKEFERKNARNKIYLESPEDAKEQAKLSIKNIYLAHKSDKAKFELLRDTLEPIELYAKSALRAYTELDKNIDFLMNLQDDRTNDIFPENEINHMLKEIFLGNTSRTKAIKELKKHKEEHSREQRQAKNASESVKKSRMEQKKDDYIPKIKAIDTSGLKDRGIGGQVLRDLRDDAEKYSVAASFADTLDNIFSGAGINKKETNTILSKHPYILLMAQSEMREYLNFTEILLERINPKKASGILPSNNPALYASLGSLMEFTERERQKKKTLIFEGLDLITDEKHREIFVSRLGCDSGRDERILKYKDRRHGEKTLLYSKLSANFGEGNYLKAKVGNGQRIVYRMDHDEDTVTAKIIYYAKTHGEHENVYITK